MARVKGTVVLTLRSDRIKQTDPDTWDVDSILDDDATEYLPEDDQLEEEEASTWSPSNTPLSQGSLHNWNLQQAQRRHEIRRQKNIRSQKVKTSGETDADTPLTKSKASGQRTKAQAYCRKQPGRYSRL